MLGKFRNRITVNTLGNTVDGGGGTTKAVVSSFDLWANVEDRTGAASYTDGQRAASYDYKITVRYYTTKTVTVANTLLYRGKELRIESVQRNNEGNVAFLTLRCNVHG